MDNYTKMLSNGMTNKGYNTEVWKPTEFMFKLPVGSFLKKWMGYIDAFIIFPLLVKFRLAKYRDDTLFVFIDQALGPWLPLVNNRAHVVHCHDFLALQSASGEFPENQTGWTGIQYQKFILRGYKTARNFICVSAETQKQLRRYVQVPDSCNRVVYNALNSQYTIINADSAKNYVHEDTQIFVENGYIVHVGGNQWYKNRTGVIQVYDTWRSTTKLHLPLLLIGETPDIELLQLAEQSRFRDDIHFLVGKSDEFIQHAYAGATVLLYPSLAEGFGWPIAEAMSCGCLVITTGLAPMTEVGGNCAFYIDRRPTNEDARIKWSKASAQVIEQVINLPEPSKDAIRALGLKHISKFDAGKTLDQIERFYLTVFQKS